MFDAGVVIVLRFSYPFSRRFFRVHPLVGALSQTLPSSRISPLLCGAMVLGMLPVAAAAEVESAQQIEVLPKIVVSATLSERAVDDVPTTVTQLTAEDMQRYAMRDLKQLFQYEPDVSIRRAPSRFTAAGASTGRAGAESINIRGLEGNQVLMLVDGVRVPNSFSFASFSTGRADYVGLSHLRQAEVLRGAASTQFGSDGLAGAVSFRTLEPQDLLKANQAVGGRVQATYQTQDQSVQTSIGLAMQQGAWQGLLHLSGLQGEEHDNQAHIDSPDSNRTKANPQDQTEYTGLAKLYYQLDDAQRLGISVESLQREIDTTVLSARAPQPTRPTDTTNLDTSDQIERHKLVLSYDLDDKQAVGIQQAQVRLYAQTAEVNQFSAETRLTAPFRTRDNTYTQDVFGISGQAQTVLEGALKQRLSYGADSQWSTMQAVRDGTVPPDGEQFPVQVFPKTDYQTAGLFVQNELETDQFSVIPAVRFDYYRLTPKQTSAANNAASLSDQAITPRLGLIWRAHRSVAPYAQWAQGFKAPTPDQVNNSFGNLAHGYRSEGNPNLQPERSKNLEIGVRGWMSDSVHYSLAAFDNRYRDFISQEVVAGRGTPVDPLVYQYINLASARIKGTEARLEWRPISPWHGFMSVAYSTGEGDKAGQIQPLDTINPLKAVLGIHYEQIKWGGHAVLTYSAAKDAADTTLIASPTNRTQRVAQFTPEAWQTIDLGAYWQPTEQLRVNANIHNLLDEKYWHWGDVRGVAANSADIDAFSAAGRGFSLALQYQF